MDPGGSPGARPGLPAIRGCVVRSNPEILMRWPFLLFLLFLLGSVLSLVLIDRVGTSRLEFGPNEAVNPRNPLLPAPARS
tara:strand:+ start:531 stop:770 length:240 start_codon:yes stop_codon:yes gene_type:complete